MSLGKKKSLIGWLNSKTLFKIDDDDYDDVEAK